MEEKFKILVLDGGGSKGIYSLGILKELELKLGSTLDNHFKLIYGTSKGSIIASLICLGKSVSEIENLYMNYVPEIMSRSSRKGKSAKLKEVSDELFGDLKFDSFKTDIGIVALNYDTQFPLVFKSNIAQAHGMKQSFTAGFGCKISDAIQASCSAYPIFDYKEVFTENQGKIRCIDGGFIANNATLFALVDADKAFKIPNENLKVISVGTGKFIEKPMGIKDRISRFFNFRKFIERVFISSTNTNVILTKLIYPHISLVRLDDTYNEPEFGTNMIEKDKTKLKKLFQLGRNCYADKEVEILDLIENN